MHIPAVHSEKAAGRTIKFFVSSFVCAYFKNSPRKYAQHRTYFGTFSRIYVIRGTPPHYSRLATAFSRSFLRSTRKVIRCAVAVTPQVTG